MVHHCSQLSIDRYKSKGYRARPSVMRKENTSISPLTSEINSRKQYTNSVSKENISVCSIYKKKIEKFSEKPSNSAVIEHILEKHNALKELPPMMIGNKDLGFGNSRNMK